MRRFLLASSTFVIVLSSSSAAHAQTPEGDLDAPIVVGAEPPPPVPQPPPAMPAPQPMPMPMQPPRYAYAYPQIRPPRPPEPLHPRRAVIDTTVGVLVLVNSDYNAASRLWGFGGFSSLAQFGLDLAIYAGRYVQLGARVAYGYGTAGRAASDQAILGLNTFDADALARIGYPIAIRSRWLLTPAVQLEVGALGAWASLRSETQSSGMPRIAALATLSFRGNWVGFNVRAGYQRAVWPDAGGHGVDFAIEGFVAGVGMEAAL